MQSLAVAEVEFITWPLTLNVSDVSRFAFDLLSRCLSFWSLPEGFAVENFIDYDDNHTLSRNRVAIPDPNKIISDIWECLQTFQSGNYSGTSLSGCMPKREKKTETAFAGQGRQSSHQIEMFYLVYFMFAFHALFLLYTYCLIVCHPKGPSDSVLE